MLLAAVPALAQERRARRIANANAANDGTIAGNDFRRSDDTFRWHSLRAPAAFRF